MARMHRRKRGKSSSQHPTERKHPSWGMNPKEIEERIVRLAEEGKPPSLIGIILRDGYGVPDIKAATGKKLTEILEEHDLLPPLPQDLANLLEKRANLDKHLAIHKKDLNNKRNLHLIEAKIRRLIRYYKREGRIPQKFSM
ncbi:MAG: 30S ribosomal protein S15 [Thermoplasmata archaeon]|nr:MAG: 30S ribosomal protein S15 [Thermoplasmata archaeon]